MLARLLTSSHLLDLQEPSSTTRCSCFKETSFITLQQLSKKSPQNIQFIHFSRPEAVSTKWCHSMALHPTSTVTLVYTEWIRHKIRLSISIDPPDVPNSSLHYNLKLVFCLTDVWCWSDASGMISHWSKKSIYINYDIVCLDLTKIHLYI